MRYAVFLFLVTVIPCNAWFEYDRAVAAGKNNQWDVAKTSLTQQLVDQPENSQLLYDAGVASYRANDFSQAASYFEHAAEITENNRLKEQSYFNAGNAYAQQKELDTAIEQYEKVLELNPDNERAKHNLEELKKQKEQEQQQQDQNQDQDNKEQQDQEQNKDQDNKNNDQNKDQSDQKENSQDQNQEQQNKEGGKKEKDSSDQQQGSESNQDADNQQEQENNEQQNSDQDKQNEEQKKSEQEQDAEQNKEEEQDQNGQEDQQQKQEEKKEDAGGGQQKEQEQQEQQAAQGQEGNANEQQMPQVDAWVARMLEQCDEHDKQKTKLLIQRNINTQEAGTDREHCW